MGHYRSAGKPGARSFESNQPVEALVNFNFDEFLESLKKASGLQTPRVVNPTITNTRRL